MATARRARPTKDEIPGAEGFLPTRITLPTPRDAIHTCRGCTLYRDATQAVFGEARSGDDAPDSESRRQAKEAFFADLALVGEYFRKL